MKPLVNILSLFDGISCGQLALNKSNIKYENYYASEIDKHAIRITAINFPQTKQLGNVNDIDFSILPKIDLLIGGSPCQSLSRVIKGEGLAGKSGLFYAFIEAKNITKPNYFLLENVKVKKQDLDIMTNLIGVEPVLINSASFSGQNRERYYWTNLPIHNYTSSSIVIKDILENNYTSNGTFTKIIKKESKSVCKMLGLADNIKGHNYNRRIYDENGKSPTLAAASGGNLEPKVAIDDTNWRKLSPMECERLQTIPDNYTNYVSKSQRYKTIGNGWTVDVIAHIFNSLQDLI